MQQLQLYIGTERVDLFKDETVSLTQTIQNVRDISKIFTEFTKTFSLPANKVNNKIFQHYYNYNIVNGFDARSKVSGYIELNTIPFKEGYIKLEGVDLKNNVAHTYRITFFGNTINLKDILGDDQLSDLSSLSAYNQTYSSTNIISKLTSVTTGEIIAPLITHTQRLFYNSNAAAVDNIAWDNSTSANGVEWDSLKFAIRLQTIIDAIEARYVTPAFSSSIVFSNDFFNDTNNEQFHNLFMWLHRKKGAVIPTTQLALNFTQLTSLTRTSGSSGYTNSINGILILIPATSGVTLQYYETTLEMTPTNLSTVYSIRILKNSNLYAERLNVTGVQTLFNTSATRLSPGQYTIQIASLSTISFTATNIEWTISMSASYYGGFFSGTDVWSNNSSFTNSAIVPFNITEQIPEMQVINFLTGLFRMFNLTAYVDNAGVIVVKTLDSYYASGSQDPIVIDRYLDVTKSSSNVALPFKEIVFRYLGIGTFLAKQYNQVNNIEWGTLKYTLDNETFDAPNNTYKVEIPFEHVMYERLVDQYNSNTTTIQYGYFVNENQESYFGLPLLFYPIRTVNGTSISVKNNTGTNQQLISYVIPSNSLEVNTQVRTNINFSAEVNEYDTNNPYNRTLFLNNYSTYISNVFDASRRLIKVNAILPQRIFHTLQLNNIIQIRKQNYQINSITTNLTNGRSELELLNVGINYYNTLTTVYYGPVPPSDYYYRASIGVASNLSIGDIIYTDKTLTTTLSSDTYTQSGSAASTTACGVGDGLTFIVDSNGVITNLTCFAP
tara:strand:+ start:1295 stop:3634 length:2340 start_codon:yes stop_codon:yes gene_type:complete